MLLSCDLVDNEELPLAWLAGLAVVLIFSNTSLDPLLFKLGTTFVVLAGSGHVRTSAGQALRYLDE